MPRYVYAAKDQPQKTIHGDIEAESEHDAINKLTQLGYFPVSVEEEGLSLERKTTFSFRKVTNKEVSFFTTQLSNLLESGVNLINALSIISNQTPNKYLKNVINDIIRNIEGGASLSESLKAHPGLFSNLYTSLVHSGEAGGSLDEALRRLAIFLEKEEEFRNSVSAALVYPFFIFLVSALTILILLGFVIPRLVLMFKDMGQALPLPTIVLISLSGFLRSFWWLIILLVFISVFLLRRVLLSPQGRFRWDRLKLKLAILGQVILKTEISRLMRTLSLLLSSGLPVLYSLEISLSVLENRFLSSEVEKFKEEISKGASFSSCLKDSKLFPAFVTNIVTVGEEGGGLEKALMRIADNYEKDVDRSLKALTRLLEPLIILIMGLIVGFIVLSMLLPIFQMNLIVR